MNSVEDEMNIQEFSLCGSLPQIRKVKATVETSSTENVRLLLWNRKSVFITAIQLLFSTRVYFCNTVYNKAQMCIQKI